jgi:hypothetical protein
MAPAPSPPTNDTPALETTQAQVCYNHTYKLICKLRSGYYGGQRNLTLWPKLTHEAA